MCVSDDVRRNICLVQRRPDTRHQHISVIEISSTTYFRTYSHVYIHLIASNTPIIYTSNTCDLLAAIVYIQFVRKMPKYNILT